MNIERYAYEADLHCVDCTTKRFGRRAMALDFAGRKPIADSEGNPLSPIFSSDECLYDEYCGDCGDQIREAWHEEFHEDSPWSDEDDEEAEEWDEED